MRAQWAGVVGAALALCILMFAGSATALPSSGQLHLVFDELGNIDPFFDVNNIGTADAPLNLVVEVSGEAEVDFDTEIVSMDLSGSTPFGPIHIETSDALKSTVGDSFFDVFFEIHMPAFDSFDVIGFHNVDPLSLVDSGGSFTSKVPVTLFYRRMGDDPAPEGAALRVGQLEFADLRIDGLEESSEAPVPEPASLVLMGLGLAGAAGARRKHGRA